MCDICCRQLESLEHSVAHDVRLILALLRQQGTKSSDSLPDSRDVSTQLYMYSLLYIGFVICEVHNSKGFHDPSRPCYLLKLLGLLAMIEY